MIIEKLVGRFRDTNKGGVTFEGYDISNIAELFSKDITFFQNRSFPIL